MQRPHQKASSWKLAKPVICLITAAVSLTGIAAENPSNKRPATGKLTKPTLGKPATPAQLVAKDATPPVKTQPQGNATTSVMPVVTVIGKNVKNPYEPTDPYNTDYAVPYTSTATRTNIPVFETPFSIETVSQQVIKDQQMVHLTDAVKNVSGVQPAFTFGEGADGFYMRGFLLGDPAVGTIIYRDGFRGVGFSMDAGNMDLALPG